MIAELWPVWIILINFGTSNSTFSWLLIYKSIFLIRLWKGLKSGTLGVGILKERKMYITYHITWQWAHTWSYLAYVLSKKALFYVVKKVELVSSPLTKCRVGVGAVISLSMYMFKKHEKLFTYWLLKCNIV